MAKTAQKKVDTTLLKSFKARWSAAWKKKLAAKGGLDQEPSPSGMDALLAPLLLNALADIPEVAAEISDVMLSEEDKYEACFELGLSEPAILWVAAVGDIYELVKADDPLVMETMIVLDTEDEACRVLVRYLVTAIVAVARATAIRCAIRKMGKLDAIAEAWAMVSAEKVHKVDIADFTRMFAVKRPEKAAKKDKPEDE